MTCVKLGNIDLVIFFHARGMRVREQFRSVLCQRQGGQRSDEDEVLEKRFAESENEDPHMLKYYKQQNAGGVD